jgi:hypothetical protein
MTTSREVCCFIKGRSSAPQSLSVENEVVIFLTLSPPSLTARVYAGFCKQLDRFPLLKYRASASQARRSILNVLNPFQIYLHKLERG